MKLLIKPRKSAASRHAISNRPAAPIPPAVHIAHNGPQRSETLQHRAGTVTLIFCECHRRLAGDIAGFIPQRFHRRDRYDFSIQPAGRLGGGDPLLAQQGIFVLRQAADPLPPCHIFRRLDHAFVASGDMAGKPGILVRFAARRQKRGLNGAGCGQWRRNGLRLLIFIAFCNLMNLAHTASMGIAATAADPWPADDQCAVAPVSFASRE
jgi:hypothetical protein